MGVNYCGIATVGKHRTNAARNTRAWHICSLHSQNAWQWHYIRGCFGI